MSFKQQYIKDIKHNIDLIPYLGNSNDRIKQIYGTARRGKLTEGLASQIWFCLSETFQITDIIPNRLIEYNEFAKEKIKCISILLAQNNRLKIGISQKIFNLFMKDLWAWDKLTIRQEKILHIPLDRNILNLLNNNPWPAWTKELTTQQQFDDAYNKYLGIQTILRKQVHYLNAESPLELEQYLWHGFL